MVLTNIDAAQTNGEEKDLETRLPHLPALENSLKQKAGSFMNRNIYAVLQDASCYYSYRIYPVITGTAKKYKIHPVITGTGKNTGSSLINNPALSMTFNNNVVY